MAESKLSCLRCQGVMETGFTLDHAHGGGSLVSQWMAGEPEFNMFGVLRMKGRTIINTIAYRCTACGSLESYARTGQP
jgi:hypothetical protein